MCEALQLALQTVAPNLLVERAHSVASMQAEARPSRTFRLVLLDLMLPDARGFSGLLAAQQAFPEARVVLISGKQDAHLVRMASAFGAAGYVFKATPLREMQVAFERVLAGELVFPAMDADADPFAADQTARLAKVAEGLSPAQLRVLIALADGRPTKLVAHDLGLSEATVKAHLSHLFRVFGITNRSQLITAARPVLGAA